MITFSIEPRSPVRGIAVLALALASAMPGPASAVTVTHNFEITTRLLPGQVFREQWDWDVYATTSTSPPSCNSLDGSKDKTVFFTPPKADSKSVKAVGCPRAFADATASLNAVSAAQNSHTVTANAAVSGPGYASAYGRATSRLGFQAGTQARNGRVGWQPGWTFDRISANSVQRVGIDPLDIAFLNLDTGEMQSSRLWDSRITLNGMGSSTWQDGRIVLDGIDGEFFVALESPFITSGTGSMRLLFENGFVTLSEDSGIFDGLLPTIGELSQMDFAFGNAAGNISIDFNFGADNNNGFVMSGASSSEASESAAIPEPASGWLAILAALIGLAVTRQGRRRGETGHPN